MSKKWNLNIEDAKKLLKETAIFSSPAILVFLVTLQTGGSFELAKGAFVQAAIAVLINTFKKLEAGK